jgi:hypothetical protein
MVTNASSKQSIEKLRIEKDDALERERIALERFRIETAAKSTGVRSTHDSRGRLAPSSRLLPQTGPRGRDGPGSRHEVDRLDGSGRDNHRDHSQGADLGTQQGGGEATGRRHEANSVQARVPH